MLLRSRTAPDASRQCGTCQYRASYNTNLAQSVRAAIAAARTPTIAAVAPACVAQHCHRDRRAAIIAAAKQPQAPDDFDDEYEEFEDEAEIADATAADVEDPADDEDELYGEFEQIPQGESCNQRDTWQPASALHDDHTYKTAFTGCPMFTCT